MNEARKLSTSAVSTAGVPKLVIFFGSDGTGKTTQALRLKELLKSQGIKTRRAWIRGRHSAAFLISQVLLKLGYRSFLLAPQAAGGKILDSRTLPMKGVWSFIEFVSVVPLLITRVYIPLILKYHVIAERYVVDTVVYNSYFIGRSFDPYSDILLKMIPKNALIVHLDASLKDVLSRRSDDLVSVDFIDYQLNAYRNLAKRLGAISVNTSIESIDAVSEIITRNLIHTK